MTMPIESEDGEQSWMARKVVQHFPREDANTRARVMELLIVARARWAPSAVTPAAMAATEPVDPKAPLTDPQYRELGRLAIGPQSTYGKGRVRIQNLLVRRGLARYVDERGEPERPDRGDGCVITAAGVAFYRGECDRRRREFTKSRRRDHA